MLSEVIGITTCGTILYVCRIMLNRFWLKLIVILAAYLLPLYNYAQTVPAAEPITTQNQAWYGYYITADFGKRWFLTMELENRQFIKPSAQNMFFLRPHLHYKLHKHWDVGVGFAYFLTTTQNPYNIGRLTTPELRLFQEANNNFTWGRLTLTNRLRIEQRWIRKTLGQQLDEGHNLSVRFRYRIALDVLLYQTEKEQHKVKLRLNDELMANIPTKVVKNIFDQNRAYAGINYQPPGPMSFEIGYLHWFQERQMSKQYFNRNVLRFSVFHKASFPVKQKAKPKRD